MEPALNPDAPTFTPTPESHSPNFVEPGPLCDTVDARIMTNLNQRSAGMAHPAPGTFVQGNPGNGNASTIIMPTDYRIPVTVQPEMMNVTVPSHAHLHPQGAHIFHAQAAHPHPLVDPLGHNIGPMGVHPQGPMLMFYNGWPGHGAGVEAGLQTLSQNAVHPNSLASSFSTTPPAAIHSEAHPGSIEMHHPHHIAGVAGVLPVPGGYGPPGSVFGSGPGSPIHPSLSGLHVPLNPNLGAIHVPVHPQISAVSPHTVSALSMMSMQLQHMPGYSGDCGFGSSIGTRSALTSASRTVMVRLDDNVRACDVVAIFEQFGDIACLDPHEIYEASVAGAGTSQSEAGNNSNEDCAPASFEQSRQATPDIGQTLRISFYDSRHAAAALAACLAPRPPPANTASELDGVARDDGTITPPPAVLLPMGMGMAPMYVPGVRSAGYAPESPPLDSDKVVTNEDVDGSSGDNFAAISDVGKDSDDSSSEPVNCGILRVVPPGDTPAPLQAVAEAFGGIGELRAVAPASASSSHRFVLEFYDLRAAARARFHPPVDAHGVPFQATFGSTTDLHEVEPSHRPVDQLVAPLQALGLHPPPSTLPPAPVASAAGSARAPTASQRVPMFLWPPPPPLPPAALIPAPLAGIPAPGIHHPGWQAPAAQLSADGVTLMPVDMPFAGHPGAVEVLPGAAMASLEGGALGFAERVAPSLAPRFAGAPAQGGGKSQRPPQEGARGGQRGKHRHNGGTKAAEAVGHGRAQAGATRSYKGGSHRVQTNGDGGAGGAKERGAAVRKKPREVVDKRAFVFDPETSQAEGGGAGSARTTLMIKNIPNKYSQKMLLATLDKSCAGRYDFFYLPIDFKNRCNLGYAFVNLTSPHAAAELYKQWHERHWEEFNSRKVCEITYARVQGQQALLEHFRNSRFPCEDDEYLPLVYEPEQCKLRPLPVGVVAPNSSHSSSNGSPKAGANKPAPPGASGRSRGSHHLRQSSTAART
mmetsp:Transcript_36545/g.70126  ORF Transcript_36545/g.70126 Transcript_36545/m.70126 type:complete len:981 (+) Transcript_36545:247-3189(+)